MDPDASQSTTGQVNNPSPDRVKENDFGENISLDKVTGVWVSNRNPKTLLTLNEDMSYHDEQWLGDGTFSINGPYLLLMEENSVSSKKDRVLKYQEEDGEITLFFTIDKYNTVFKPATEDDIAEVEALIQQEKEAEANASCGDSFETISEILFAQGWNTSAGVIRFSDGSISITAADGTEAQYSYSVTGEVVGAEGDPFVYTIPVEIKDASGTTVSTSPITLMTGSDGFFVHLEINHTTYDGSVSSDDAGAAVS